VTDPNSKSLFPRHLDSLPEEKRSALYEELRSGIELAYIRTMESLRNSGPWDAIIHLGDITGGYGESGCAHHEEARKLTLRCRSDMQRIAPRVFACVGNHDLGYGHIGSLEADVTTASVEFCEQTFGPLFWSFDAGGILCIGICSSFADYKGKDPTLLKRAHEQKVFIADTLASTKDPWILFSHSPWSAKFLAREITPHLTRLKQMISGDLHDPKKAWVIKSARRVLPIAQSNVLFHCLRNWTFCPSTAPLWWQGYQCLGLSVNAFGVAEEVIHGVLPMKNLPTASFMRCTWWCVKPKPKQS